MADYKAGPKEKFIREIFSTIAHRYDILNTVLSFNQDGYWRRFAASQTKLRPGGYALDICCGTGKLTYELAKLVGMDGKVIGLDFCPDMLRQAKINLESTLYAQIIELREGNAMALPFCDNSFDCATIAFGLRNVPNIKQVLFEMLRVVKPGGSVVSLELAKPALPVFKEVYYFYFEHVLPLVGKLGLGKEGPYRWLPDSLRQYPDQEIVCELFREVGLRRVKYYELTGGIVAVHVGLV